MFMVVLVDDPYEGTCPVGPRKTRGAYEVRRKQKKAASVARSPRDIGGLVVGWYRPGEDEIIAPLRREDFDILARASGMYTDAARLEATFNCIQRERVVRRTCGRKLSSLLSHLAAGKHYDIALKSADAIGTALEQVAAAVSLREVESVRNLGKESFWREGA
jgi:hypothetical protein